MSSFNYIKAYRRRTNLTQQELAFLLGYADNSHVSRVEQGKQEPSLSDTITCELLFNLAACRLFPDVYTSISNKLLQRLDLLQQHLNGEPSTQTSVEKLAVIREIRKTIATDNKNRV